VNHSPFYSHLFIPRAKTFILIHVRPPPRVPCRQRRAFNVRPAPPSASAAPSTCALLPAQQLQRAPCRQRRAFNLCLAATPATSACALPPAPRLQRAPCRRQAPSTSIALQIAPPPSDLQIKDQVHAARAACLRPADHAPRPAPLLRLLLHPSRLHLSLTPLTPLAAGRGQFLFLR
jgi:hypothetical protein